MPTQKPLQILRLEDYTVEDAGNISSPQLLFYQEKIARNVSEIIRIAGGTERLWPHIKTHKSPDLTRMLLDQGITRFKCATIAECEMVASLKPSDICLAYPLVGPNIGRFAALVEAFPEVRFWAIADDLGQLEKMNEAYSNLNVRVLVDLDLGMNRTGVPLDQVVEFMEQARFYENLSLAGFHCYDGHIIDEDYSEREYRVEQNSEQLAAIQEELKTRGLELPIIISGGSITFTIHVKTAEQYFSPGTYFLNDKGYYSKYREVDCPPAATILTRVVSHGHDGIFTIDLGVKAIASESTLEDRLYLLGLGESVRFLQHSEEHLVCQMLYGDLPQIGDVLYAIPHHICPTVSLYDEAFLIVDKEFSEIWPITARTRNITL